MPPRSQSRSSLSPSKRPRKHRSGKHEAPSAARPGWVASAAQGCAAAVSADRMSARTEATHPGRAAPPPQADKPTRHRSKQRSRVAAGTDSHREPLSSLTHQGAQTSTRETQSAERRPVGVGRVSGTGMCRDGECGQDVRSNRSDPPRQGGAPTASRPTNRPPHPRHKKKARLQRTASGPCSLPHVGMQDDSAQIIPKLHAALQNNTCRYRSPRDRVGISPIQQPT